MTFLISLGKQKSKIHHLSPITRLSLSTIVSAGGGVDTLEAMEVAVMVEVTMVATVITTGQLE